MARLEDFGEHIGLARKDMFKARWSGRVLVPTDIVDLTDREILEEVTKFRVWPKPDYVKLQEETGISSLNLYYLKLSYDKLPAKIGAMRGEDSEGLATMYITFLNEWKEYTLQELKGDVDLKKLYSKFLISHGYYEGGATSYSSHWLPKSKNNPAISNLWIKALSLSSQEIRQMQLEVDLMGFPQSYCKDVVGCVYVEGSALTIDGVKSEYNNYLAYGPQRRYRIPVADRADAIVAIREYMATGTIRGDLTKEAATAKVAEFKRPTIDASLLMTDDISKSECTPDDIMNTFNIRGGEFGLWLNDIEGRYALNAFYFSLCDLAMVTGLRRQDVGLGSIELGSSKKRLAIAFGARGKGKANAHYEPERVVINLTRMRGAGSLAHEYGHAVQDVIDSLIPEAYPRLIQTYKKLLDSLKRRATTKEELLAIYTRSAKRFKAFNERTSDKLIAAANRGKRKNRSYEPLSEKALETLLTAIEEFKVGHLSGREVLVVYKELIGCKPSADILEDLEYRGSLYMNTLKDIEEIDTETDTGTTHSHFLEFANLLDKSKGKAYYSLEHELFARAFESYIEDKLSHTNYYLVHSTHNSKYEGFSLLGGGKVKPYPEGEERELFNSLFTTLMADLARVYATRSNSELKEPPTFETLTQESLQLLDETSVFVGYLSPAYSEICAFKAGNHWCYYFVVNDKVVVYKLAEQVNLRGLSSTIDEFTGTIRELFWLSSVHCTYKLSSETSDLGTPIQDGIVLGRKVFDFW